MKKDLVSIITPCYNSATYIHRLLDSILMQDYPSIEMFTIDDGSTDNTRKVIESYIPKFEDRGYKLTYLYQENAGQAAALNRGLKCISGEYLAWPDSDDYFRYNYSISAMAEVMAKSDDSYGMVRCQNQFIEENTLSELCGSFHYTKDERLFLPFLTGQEFGGGAGVFMVKMMAFDNVVPNREIYIGREAQNCQMLLPLFYSYLCKTISDKWINIVVRSRSHSHTIKSYEGQLDDVQAYIDIYTNTLRRMRNLSQQELEEYLHIVNLRFLNDKLTLALNFNRCHDARNFARSIKTTGGGLTIGKRIKLLLSYCPPILKMTKWFQKKYSRR